MWNKLVEVLGSIRFWQLTVGAVLLLLAYYGIVPQDLANLIATYLGISIGIRTIDNFRQ